MQILKGQLFTLMLVATVALTTACSPKQTTPSSNKNFDTFLTQISADIEKENKSNKKDFARKKTYVSKLRGYNIETLDDSQLLTRNVLLDLMEREVNLHDADKKQTGVKNGKKKYYQALLEKKVGTDMSAEDAITTLESEVDSIQESINDLLEENEDLSLDYQAALPTLTDPDDIVRELESDTNIYYPSIEKVSYDIEEMPERLADHSNVALYVKPSIDKKEVNTIYVNSVRVNSEELFPTLAHESYPGHLYQTNYALQKHFPSIRYQITCEGYDEGWGVYAQMSAYEYMEFQDVDKTTNKNLQELSRLNDIRNIYLLTLSDIYVNYQNYKEDTLANYLKHYRIDKTQASAIYDYVIKNPCDYPVYGLGYYEFSQLEQKAQKKLGDDFDLKYFRKQVLDKGSCSFPVLKKLLNL